ncbi:peptidase M48 [Sphingomonas sp. Root50]|nr:peptidase M48 [Sphingomonas sp. Root1294]KQY69404.1 peptidase M48 [Sphingomonas sp. Root50]KRB89813.1 peptidase M48 [Sphingomonas sp. Root720]
MVRIGFSSGLFGLAITLASLPVGARVPDTVPLPPFTQAYQPQGVDERGMWMEADEDERVLRDSRFVIPDTELNAYVRGVFCRTVGEERCRNVRVYVLRVPQFNATMYPNGMMTIWSGLLLRVRNEAELGAVLGHEFAHFELRHSLKGFMARRSASDIQMWANILVSNSSIPHAVAGAFYAFERDQEKEADLRGAHYLGLSPYPATAAADVWDRQIAEQDATELGRKRKATHSYKAGYAASHPTGLARATYLRQEAARIGDGGDTAASAYRQGTAKWLPIFLDDQIKLNDFGGTEFILQSLAGNEWTPELLYARAELYRQRGNPRDLVSAAQFYQEAVAGGCANPEVHRGLGLVLMRSQQVEAGQAALRQYLGLVPDAKDAPMISALLAN